MVWSETRSEKKPSEGKRKQEPKNSRRQMPQPILKPLTQRRSQLTELILQLPLHTLSSTQLSRSSIPSLSSSSDSSSELNRLLVERGTELPRPFADDGFREGDKMFQSVEDGGSAGPGFEEGFRAKDAVFGGGFFSVTEGGSKGRLDRAVRLEEVRSEQRSGEEGRKKGEGGL